MTIQSFINKQALFDVRMKYRHKTVNYIVISKMLNSLSDDDFTDTQNVLDALEIEVFSCTETSLMDKNPAKQAKVMKEMFEAAKNKWIEMLKSISIDIDSNINVDTVLLYESRTNVLITKDDNSLDIVKNCLLSEIDTNSTIQHLYSHFGIMGYKKLFIDSITKRVFSYYEKFSKKQLTEVIFSQS